MALGENPLDSPAQNHALRRLLPASFRHQVMTGHPFSG